MFHCLTHRSLPAFAATALLALSIRPASSAEIIWDGDTTLNDDWSEGTNWSLNRVPAAGDNVRINTGSSEAAPVIYDTGSLLSTNNIILGEGVGQAGYLTMQSGTLEFTSSSSYIGQSGFGHLVIENGATFRKATGPFTAGLNAGSTGILTVNTGGTLSFVGVNSNMIVSNAGDGTVELFGGTMILGDPQGSNNRNFNLGTSTGQGLIDIRGGTISAATSVARWGLNVGYNGTDSGTGNGTLKGFGTLNLNNQGGIGLIQIGGQVIADGTQVNNSVTDSTLTINSSNLSTALNTSGSTHFGLYTQNQGALNLNPVSVGGIGHTFWGDDQASSSRWTPGSATTVMVNSAYIHSTGATTATQLDVSLLDPSRTTAIDGFTSLLDAPTDVAFLNIWELNPTDGDIFVDIFSVRYDEAFSDVNAADKFGDLLGFYYWDGTSGSWIDLTAGTTLDEVNFLAQWSGSALGISSGESGYFALGAMPIPEPSTGALVALGVLATMGLRRSRNR